MSGKNLVSRLYDAALNRNQTPIPVGENGVGSFFYMLGSVGASIWGASGLMTDFVEVPELNAVIGWKARAFSNMKLEVVSKTTLKAVDVANNETLVKTIRNPNYFQSQKELLMQTKIWQEVYGNEYLFFDTPAARPNTYNGLFTLNPEYLTIEYGSETVPYYMVDKLPANIRYKMTWGGVERDVTDNVIHINNTNLSPDSGNWLKGHSNIDTLNACITNIRASYEARNVIISNRGALGILSNGSVDGMGSILPMDPKEKESLQTALKGYGLSKNQHQFIVTNLNLKWQQMAVDSDKLQLHKECEESFKTICNVYGVNYEIFANDNTYENKRAAERATYQNTIIPEAEEWVAALNRKLGTENKSWTIKCSFDHLPIFSENIKERAATLNLITTSLDKAYINNIITREEYRAELKKFKVGEL